MRGRGARLRCRRNKCAGREYRRRFLVVDEAVSIPSSRKRRERRRCPVRRRLVLAAAIEEPREARKLGILYNKFLDGIERESRSWRERFNTERTGRLC